MRRPSRFGRFVLASAALHALALLLATRVDWSPLPRMPEPLTVRVIPLAPPAPPATGRPAAPQPPPEARTARPAPRVTPAPRATPAPRPTPVPRTAPTPPPTSRPDGQVVDLPNRPRPRERNEPPPDDTRFLSDRNRTVERETRAPATPAAPDRAPGAPGAPDGTRSTGPTEPLPGARPRAEAEAPAARAGPEVPPPVEAPRPAPPREAARPTPPPAPTVPVPPPRTEPSVAQPAPSAPSVEPRADAPAQPVGRATPPPARPGDGDTQVARVEPPRPAPPAVPRPETPVEPPRDLPPPGSPGTTSRARTSPDPNRRPDTDGDGDGSRRTLPGLDRLLPGPGQLARVDPNAAEPRRGAGGQGGGRASDYLPGIDEGEETFLNSREFRYAYYFNQVKRGIASQWNPQRVLDSTREAVPRESLTELFLVIGKDGRVESAEVTRPSGVASLDREAVRAARAAGPYPAPPAGVLDPDGRLRFPFGFAVMAGSGRITYFGPDDRDLRDLFRRPPFRPRP